VVADCFVFQPLPPALESPSIHLNARFCVCLLIALTGCGPLFSPATSLQSHVHLVYFDVRPYILLRATVVLILRNAFGM
jgi:hypothetical protein